MRTIRNILFAIAALAALHSCIEEGPEVAAPQIGGTFGFSVAVPVMRNVHTRAAVAEGVLQNMFVLVFDSNGSFLSRTEAVQTGSDPGSYTVRLAPTDQTLPQTDRKRIVHFVANCDWTEFSDVGSLGRNENDVIMNLYTTGGVTAYWQRVELADGIKEGVFGDAAIELIGNTARISLLNNSADNGITGARTLTQVSFAIGNYRDCGTIAPFNTKTQVFDETGETESQFAAIIAVQEADFVNAGTGSATDGTFYCYPARNSGSSNPMFVIMKGLFPGDANPTYYKIDIVYSGEAQLPDISRNHHFVIDLKAVTSPGYPTLAGAMAGPAANNIIYSVQMAKYTSVSFGGAALYVEYTERTFVRPDQDFYILYRYFPDLEGDEDNSSVQLVMQNEDDTKPVLSDYSLTRTQGNAHIKGTTAAALPPYGYYNARFIVSSNESGTKLLRVINLKLRHPWNFGSAAISADTRPATNGGRPVKLAFTIPDPGPEFEFPIDVYIRTTVLMPNVTPGYPNNLSIDYSEPGSYRYTYVATAPGTHTVYLKTLSSATAQGPLSLESELLAPFTIQVDY